MIADAPILPAPPVDLDSPVHRSFDALEAEMRTMPPVEMEPTHFFSPGVYARQIVIPPGTLLTGKIHLYDHLNIVSAGEISVWSESEGVRRIRAPFSFVAKAGTRRVGYAHTETVWTTIHANPDDGRDLAALEQRLIHKHEAAQLQNTERIEMNTGGVK